MNRKLYFAYGMNLNHEHMAQSCPTAIPIGPAKIQGYRLIFRRFANIVKSNPEDCVWGGCWAIDDEAEAALDIIESYPLLYDKLIIDGMLTYQMQGHEGHMYNNMEPSPIYLDMILEGLLDFNLSPEILEQNQGY